MWGRFPNLPVLELAELSSALSRFNIEVRRNGARASRPPIAARCGRDARAPTLLPRLDTALGRLEPAPREVALSNYSPWANSRFASSS